MPITLPAHEKRLVRRILEVGKSRRSFLITTHTALDGDCIGCEVALGRSLEKAGKRVVTVNDDPVPELYSFLPGAKRIREYQPGMKRHQVDAVFVLDCANLDRIGRVQDILPPAVPIINIDHHPGNDCFGTINWVNSSYAACSEMLFFLLREWGGIDRHQAAGLYAALLSDTGSFQYHFGPQTFLVARELLGKGIDPEKIARKIYLDRPLRAVRLLGLCLKTIRFKKSLRVCWMKVEQKMYKETGTAEEDTDRFIDVLRSVKEAEAVFLLKERPDGVRVSLRGRSNFDVAQVAGVLAGGGHRAAAGCFLSGVGLKEAERKVLRTIRESLHGRNR